MRIIYANSELERFESEDNPPTEKYSVGVIKATRKKIHALRSFTDERELWNWKSLHYEKLSGDRAGQRSIRINKQMRMILEVNNDAEPNEVTIVEVCDYH